MLTKFEIIVTTQEYLNYITNSILSPFTINSKLEEESIFYEIPLLIKLASKFQLLDSKFRFPFDFNVEMNMGF